MKKTHYTSPKLKPNASDDPNQKGSAIVIALFILALLGVFVALALTRTATEAAAVGNETAEGRTLYAAQASLETMTRNFTKVFEVKLNPSQTDLDKVRNGTVPGLSGAGTASGFTFRQTLLKTSDSSTKVLPEGSFKGLYAIQDNWNLTTNATDASGVNVELTRNVLNNRIPIFQFGIFYNDDLELYRPPRFAFGGRVHSNRHFFISPGAEGVYFNSRITVVGQVVTQSWRNGHTGDMNNNQTFIKNAVNADAQLLPAKSSVLNTTANAADNIFAGTDLPPSKINPNWKSTDSLIFDGNLKNGVDKLELPLSIGGEDEATKARLLIEMVKRGKQPGDVWSNNGTVSPVTAADADDSVMTAERFANKTGFRISLADRKEKLPGCAVVGSTAAVAAACGIRLDGHINGQGGEPVAPRNCTTKGKGKKRGPHVFGCDDRADESRGYEPLPMLDGYQATRINGSRFFVNQTLPDGRPRQVWIKVETVETDPTTNAIVTRDITADILSLGVTERGSDTPNGQTDTLKIEGYGTRNDPEPMRTDNRSIIKLQRFAVVGQAIPGEPNINPLPTGFTTATKFLYQHTPVAGGTVYNVAVRYFGQKDKIDDYCTSGCTSINDDPSVTNNENFGQFETADIAGGNKAAIVPFPIKMFDTREAVYNDARGTYMDWNGSAWVCKTSGVFKDCQVVRNGVMSMIDIDVANLRRFLNGDFNLLLPRTTPFANGGLTGLRNTDIPDRNGWVLHISDRRGDFDFDGELDMENVYTGDPAESVTNGATAFDSGEDVNLNNRLEVDYTNEADRYNQAWYGDRAAASDHRYYRRGIRLINGTTMPGRYDSANAANTKGFTVSSENGVYVQGNYNATGISGGGTTGNSTFNQYLPNNTPEDIPASIVADSVTVLSNAWNDTKSFANPYDQYKRTAAETTVRFAMISGDAIAAKGVNEGGSFVTPNQGGISPKMNGGVHNFKRFLETWVHPSDTTVRNRLNYCGSLINLFVARNNTGTFKCCDTVYNPPVRNWVFDSRFLDPGRLPPGTPFFQYVQTTGFQRTND